MLTSNSPPRIGIAAHRRRARQIDRIELALDWLAQVDRCTDAERCDRGATFGVNPCGRVRTNQQAFAAAGAGVKRAWNERSLAGHQFSVGVPSAIDVDAM